MKKITKIMILCLVSMFVFSGCNEDTKKNNTTDNKSASESSTKEELNSKKEENTSEKDEDIENDISDNPIKVMVYDVSGDAVKSEHDSVEEALQKPDILNYKEVFSGWQEDDTIIQLKNDNTDNNDEVVLTAESIDISELNNVVYNDACYVNNDSATEFVIPITVGGNTEFSILEMEISYDTKLMEFVEFSYSDPDAMCNCIKNEGKIYISFISTENIYSDVSLCDIKFKTLTTDKIETKLDYNIVDIAKWDDMIDNYRSVNYELVNGKIVMY